MAVVKRRPWQFPDSEVRISESEDAVLGKGAYGEVRRGYWRGIPIAAKRLHMLSNGTGSVPAAWSCAIRRIVVRYLRRHGPT